MGTSAPSGETRYNWNEDMAPRWNSLLNTAPWETGFQFNSQGNIVGIGDRAQFTGQRFAPTVYDQQAAGTNIRALNDHSSNPVTSMNAARGQIENTLGGNYLGSNPFARVNADNPYIGGNQYQDLNTSTDRNVFAGDNPYARDLLNQSLEDTTNAYQRGTAADTTRMFNMAGAFGGSAHQNAVANNEANLGKTLSNQVNQFANTQFDRSAGLEDSFLGRDIQNQQFNRSTSSGLAENAINRGFQNYQQGSDRGFQGYENERNRMMGAVGAGQAEQGLALGRAGAQMDFGNFMQGQDQRNRDFGFDQWNQNQQHPFQMMDWLSGLYGRAQGGMAPNSQVYQSGSSGAMPYVGAGFSLASLFG